MSSPVTAYLKAQRRTMASVFPIEMRVDRRHNGFTTYLLPAAPKEGVSTLTIDRIERGLSCRMDTKRKILEALGLTPQDRVMVFGEDD